MADKLHAGWTPEFEQGMNRMKVRTIIISGPSSKPNPVLKKYEVQYAEVPVGQIHNEKKHPTKIKFFTNKKDANEWVKEVAG